MSRQGRSSKGVFAGLGLGMMALADPAAAADLPLKAPVMQAIFDWTGFYVGAHVGYGRGTSNAVLTDPTVTAGPGVASGMIGGVQAGYNHRFQSGLLLGVEGDLTFPNYFISNSILSLLASPNSTVAEAWDYVGTVRGRIGYAPGSWLFYATGGLAFAGERFVSTPVLGND